MVNSLSELAEFLDVDSLPSWLKTELKNQQEAIFSALEKGDTFTIHGPDGEEVKIAPRPVAAA